MRRLVPLLTAALAVALLPATSATAQQPSTLSVAASERPMMQPRAAAAAGTPLTLLAATPAVPPLRVGYKPGMFPTLASRAKDARGCTLRNQMLIKLATKKPQVLKGCTLKGGLWAVDFGTKQITAASQVRLNKLVPDVYVYGQGASQWTPAQRAAYVTVVPPAKVSGGKQTRSKDVRAMEQAYVGPQPATIVPLSLSGQRLLTALNASLAGTAEISQATLDSIRAINPALFEGWTVATLLNARAWGLTLSPSLYTDFQQTLNECTPMVRTVAPLDVSQQPCAVTYSVPEESVSYRIAEVPQVASTVPQVNEEVLRGYGTPTGETISRFMFGIHAPADWLSDEASGADGPIYPATIPDVPVGYLRLWDTETTWKDIEPKNGTYVWRKLDKQIQMAQQLDARAMLVLGQTPAWAASQPTGMPANIADWRDYVSTVCKRYGASISAYEVWNEANLTTFWTGSPAQMAELTKVAFEEIRACNPSALVVAANTTSRATGSFGTFFPDYLQEMKARGWPADAYSVHSYPTASGGANDRIEGIGQFRAALALAGAPFTTTFDTEINYGLAGLGEGKVDLVGENAMTLLSRTYIDSARYGFGSTFWFVWTAKPDAKFGIQFTRQAAAERRAWNTTYDWLVGSRFQRCINTKDGITVCQFSNGNGNFSIVWQGDVGSAPRATSAGTFAGLGSRTCDLYSNCQALTTDRALSVGPMPIRIDGAPLTSGPAVPTPAPSVTPTPPTDIVRKAPVITSVDVQYEVSNKTDAVARWHSDASLSQLAAAPITSYEYVWKFCRGAECAVVAQGTTSANVTSSSAALTEGPGRYTFEVRAVQANAPSPWALKEFEVLASRAAPPRDLLWWLEPAGVPAVEVSWLPPIMRPELLQGYEVQFRNVTTDSAWKTVEKSTTRTSVSIPASELPIKAGQTGVFRVRTLLRNGATSDFVSMEWRAVERVNAPTLMAANLDDERLQLFAWSQDLNGKFPADAFQMQYSLDGGRTWKDALLSPEFRTNQRISPSRLPIAKVIYAETPGLTAAVAASGLVKGRIRGLTDDGRLPSAWRDVTQ